MLTFLGILYIVFVLSMGAVIVINEREDIKYLWERDRWYIIMLITGYLLVAIISPFILMWDYFDKEYDLNEKLRNRRR